MSGGKSKPKKYGNAEREPKRTNVGGRPPARDIIPRKIPRGLEVLIKKAAVDAAFKKLLLEKRAGAAEATGLKLTAAEEAMLSAVPLPQLEGIIAHTRISPNLRPAFLGYAAGAMLAALGMSLIVCERGERGCKTGKRETATLADALTTIQKSTPVGATEHKNAGKKNETTKIPAFSETRSQTNVVDLDAIASATAVIRGYRPRKNSKSGRGVNRINSLGIRPDVSFRKSREPGFVSVSSPTSIAGTAAPHANRTPQVIESVVRRYLFGIENAYNSALRKNPTLGLGKIVVRFTITPDGAVAAAQIVSDTLGEPALRGTIISRIRSWRFPPADGGDVTVIYRFIFVAGEV